MSFRLSKQYRGYNDREGLNEESSRAEAVEIPRGVIDEIQLRPNDGQLDIYPIGNLAEILTLCTNKNPGAKNTGVQITLVAGARKHLYLTVLIWRRKAP